MIFKYNIEYMSKRDIDKILRQNIMIGRGRYLSKSKLSKTLPKYSLVPKHRIQKGHYGSKYSVKRAGNFYNSKCITKIYQGMGRKKGPLTLYIESLDKEFKKRYRGRTKKIPLTIVQKIARLQMKNG